MAGQSSATIDFGSTPVAEAVFTITDASITATSAVECFVQADSTVDNDVDAHRAAGRSFRMAPTPAAGSFSLDVMCLIGLCTGTFKIRYAYA